MTQVTFVTPDTNTMSLIDSNLLLSRAYSLTVRYFDRSLPDDLRHSFLVEAMEILARIAIA